MMTDDSLFYIRYRISDTHPLVETKLMSETDVCVELRNLIERHTNISVRALKSCSPRTLVLAMHAIAEMSPTSLDEDLSIILHPVADAIYQGIDDRMIPNWMEIDSETYQFLHVLGPRVESALREWVRDGVLEGRPSTQDQLYVGEWLKSRGAEDLIPGFLGTWGRDEDQLRAWIREFENELWPQVFCPRRVYGSVMRRVHGRAFSTLGELPAGIRDGAPTEIDNKAVERVLWEALGIGPESGNLVDAGDGVVAAVATAPDGRTHAVWTALP